MPPIHILIKPVSSSCNLKCNYCFYQDIAESRSQASYGSMTIAVLEQVIKKTLAFAEKECTFAYQGGEPTLAGLDFYRKALELQKKYNINHVRIQNAIQTNGYQLDKNWAEFFYMHQFLVGISLDGRKDTHDAYRKDFNGNGTFFSTLNTIQLFQKYKVDFNILMVVNKQTSRQAKKIYEFYKKNNLSFLQFIPCLDPIGQKPGGEEFSLEPSQYGLFLIEVFDLWYEDLKVGKQPFIRQFENYIALLLGMRPEACDQGGMCSCQHVIEADGGVYPCDFYVLDQYKLGNLLTSSMEEIQRKRKEIQFVEYSLTDHENCHSCPYYKICRGGCRRHRILKKDGAYFENYLCEGYRLFFKHSLPILQEITDKLS